MEKIKAYIDYNDYTKQHYYETFEIIDDLPKNGDLFHGRKIDNINAVALDCGQPNCQSWNYNYYELKLIDYDEYNSDLELDKELYHDNDVEIEDYIYYEYVAIKKSED